MNKGGVLPEGSGDYGFIYKDDYIVPKSTARRYSLDLLRKINEELDKPDEDVLD